jgi:hypothetical protein
VTLHALLAAGTVRYPALKLLCKPTWKVSDETFVGGVSMPWIPWLDALGWIYICDQKAEWI